MVVEIVPDGPGGGLDIRGLKQGGDDHDAASSGGEDLRQGFRGDAADAEGGDFPTGIAFHDRDFMKADGGAAGFGGGGKQRAEADVVESSLEGGPGLFQGVGGAAEEKCGVRSAGCGMEESAGFGERTIVLADVDTVTIQCGGEGRVVVEDEGDSGGAAKR